LSWERRVASQSGYNKPRVHPTGYSAAYDAKSSLSYKFDAFDGMGEAKDLPDTVEATVKQELLDELIKSEYFKEVAENSKLADTNN